LRGCFTIERKKGEKRFRQLSERLRGFSKGVVIAWRGRGQGGEKAKVGGSPPYVLEKSHVSGGRRGRNFPNDRRARAGKIETSPYSRKGERTLGGGRGRKSHHRTSPKKLNISSERRTLTGKGGVGLTLFAISDRVEEEPPRKGKVVAGGEKRNRGSC